MWNVASIEISKCVYYYILQTIYFFLMCHIFKLQSRKMFQSAEAAARYVLRGDPTFNQSSSHTSISSRSHSGTNTTIQSHGQQPQDNLTTSAVGQSAIGSYRSACGISTTNAVPTIPQSNIDSLPHLPSPPLHLSPSLLHSVDTHHVSSPMYHNTSPSPNHNSNRREPSSPSFNRNSDILSCTSPLIATNTTIQSHGQQPQDNLTTSAVGQSAIGSYRSACGISTTNAVPTIPQSNIDSLPHLPSPPLHLSPSLLHSVDTHHVSSPMYHNTSPSPNHNSNRRESMSPSFNYRSTRRRSIDSVLDLSVSQPRSKRRRLSPVTSSSLQSQIPQRRPLTEIVDASNGPSRAKRRRLASASDSSDRESNHTVHLDESPQIPPRHLQKFCSLVSREMSTLLSRNPSAVDANDSDPPKMTFEHIRVVELFCYTF